ncbi:MAG: hypothetical protein AAF698_07535 [Pseudomonadota bacterium]
METDAGAPERSTDPVPQLPTVLLVTVPGAKAPLKPVMVDVGAAVVTAATAAHAKTNERSNAPCCY